MNLNDRARLLGLDYRPPRADFAERRSLHPRQIIGIYLLGASVVGIVFLCICASQVSANFDWSPETLAIGTVGIFLIILAIPGLGLLGEKPRAEDFEKDQ